jgi:hypothetical protein
MDNEKTREQWEKELLDWWDGNQMDELEGPPVEALWDAFESIADLVKIIKQEHS